MRGFTRRFGPFSRLSQAVPQLHSAEGAHVEAAGEVLVQHALELVDLDAVVERGRRRVDAGVDLPATHLVGVVDEDVRAAQAMPEARLPRERDLRAEPARGDERLELRVERR